MHSKHPSLYQINTRVLLNSLSPTATLDDVSDDYVDELAALGFSWIWLLGVWQTGVQGPRISATNPEWKAEYERVLPDLTVNDICGSPFAIYEYRTDARLGGDAALERFRRRLHARGMKLLVDFVPNHVALDHPWTKSSPEFLIQGPADYPERAPHDWTRLPHYTVVAHGRDPNYPGWIDTLQLNYFNPALHDAMIRELLSIAERADGVRCDMAMLLEPEVFESTWSGIPGYEGKRCPPFWQGCIDRVRSTHPDFLMIAEVYWGYERKLQALGFDYTYDKVLYDRLTHQTGRDVATHLQAELAFQEKSARFLENHDEPRAAAVFALPQHRAAAAITFFAPGLRFFHQGQLDGHKVRIPVHLCRGPSEPSDAHVQSFYQSLLPLLHRKAARDGSWSLLNCYPAWLGNPSHEQYICQLLRLGDDLLLISVNYAPHQGQCFVQLPSDIVRTRECVFIDLLSDVTYARAAGDLQARGLYLDTPGWHVHIFEIKHS